jgi:hypothetical protein
MAWSQVETFKRDAQGRIFVNPAKDYIQPFELTLDNPNQVVVLAPGQVAPSIPMTARYDGPIEVFYIKAVVKDEQGVALTTFDVDWFMDHPGKRKTFMNRVIPLEATSGDAAGPYVLPESIFIPAVQCLNVTFQNNDSETRQVEFVLGGIKYYPNAAPQEIRDELWGYIDRRERTYTYFQTTDVALVLPAAATDVPAFVTVPDDADLDIFKLSARSSASFRTRIRDSQSDRALTGAKIHSSLLFGGRKATPTTAGVGGSGSVFPARWATSFLVRRSIKFQLDFDNLDAQSPNTVKIVFGGRKIAYST